jgi:hypothetical protein
MAKTDTKSAHVALQVLLRREPVNLGYLKIALKGLH